MLRIIATTCVLGLLASPTAMAGQADLILVGAKVLTGDSNRPAAEAVALAGERIRAVGPSAEILRLAGPRTRVVDLRGRTVIADSSRARNLLLDREMSMSVAEKL